MKTSRPQRVVAVPAGHAPLDDEKIGSLGGLGRQVRGERGIDKDRAGVRTGKAAEFRAGLFAGGEIVPIAECPAPRPARFTITGRVMNDASAAPACRRLSAASLPGTSSAAMLICSRAPATAASSATSFHDASRPTLTTAGTPRTWNHITTSRRASLRPQSAGTRKAGRALSTTLRRLQRHTPCGTRARR